MKFGKEFTAQMCQEWQQAYMDYNLLKSILKDIFTLRQPLQNQSTPASATSSPSPSMQQKANSLRRKVSLYRAFSGLTTRYRSSPRKRDEEAILVSAVRRRSGAGGGDPPAAEEEEHYQTMFMMPSDESGEQELEFFRRLDEEFNKVISFYRKKVGEVVDEADELTRQMNALIALRIKIQNPSQIAASHNVIKPGRKRMDAIQEVELTSEEGHMRGHLVVGSRPASLEILEHVKINVAPDTPISKLKGILTCSSSFTKDQLNKSEELMVQAFVEFYHKLRLLKSYCFMNQLGFSKIMKKYDKVTQRNASRAYLDMIDKSYLNTCDEVILLMERVEKAFVKHFSNGNHRNGMNVLRPKKRKERHTVTFYLGLLVGCSLALVVTILVLIQSRNIIQSQGRTRYMDNIFPLYSLFGYIVLHMIMFSVNIYYWRRYRINYPFIFGLKEGTDLGYREVFLLSAGLSVLSLAAVISSLDMDLNPETRSYDTFREVVPLILIGVLLLITFCPFNILYRSSRYFVILTMYHCLLAPFYKVSLPDFFMGDQLTSQVQALRSLLFYVFYYIWGDFRRREPGTFEDDNNVYKAMYIVVAIFPYWWRFLQCARRLVEEKGSMHALNGLKYFLIIVAVVVRTTFEQKNNAFLKPGNPTGVQKSVIVLLQILAAVTSSIATIYATYWDIVVDWGLLRRKSTNCWLRDKLIIPNKAVYFVAIVLNCLLRLAWMQTVLGIREAPFIHRKALIAIVAILEIIRRGLWNFFRIENEHLNNVGKYRAFKSVPLPFNYYDDDQKSS